MPGQPLNSVPVIESGRDGKLQGTIILGDEQEWMPARVPDVAPSSNSRSQCQPQWVRTFRKFGTTSNMASAPYGPYATEPHAPLKKVQYALPMPGPTLRARVGELIELTFINQINPGDFTKSMDRGETGAGGGCDESGSVYPGADKYPDCFHGSSTGNIHFHGTHTNPNSTGDNVFIEVRPSLIVNGKPVVTPQTVASSFQDFFRRCEVELSYNVLKEWPTTWNDLPAAWTTEQKWLLQRYDAEMQQKYPGARKLWPVNEEQLKKGAWPQYYIGSFPYCFRLPEYKATKWPPAAPMSMQMDGAGTAEMPADGDVYNRSLIMGQSPGTHWYHAHKHGSTAINVANGMTGAFIIEGQYDDDLNKWYGSGWTRNQPVLVINQLGVSPNLMRGGAGQDKGPDFSINGQIQPKIQMYPGEVQMWRIVNTSGRASVLFTGPPSGFEWKQLAQDGVQFIDANYQSHANKPFLLAPGNRADILIKAPPATSEVAQGCPCPVIVKNEVDPLDLVGTSPAKPLTLLTVNLSGTAPKTATPNNSKFIPTAPGFPPFLADVSDSEVKGTKVITFSSSNNPLSDAKPPQVQHMIDGKEFDGEVGAVVLLNQAEEWKIVNETYGNRIVSHPFHIHINPFQITEVFSPNEFVDPNAKAPLPKYVFIDPSKPSPPILNPGQCALNPYDESTWRSLTWVPETPAKPAHCVPTSVPTNNIWWDVFPIPSGQITGFPVLDKDGKPVIDPNTKKAVQVAVPGYFKMRSRFVDYSGFYVIHCHILAHEDRGMMTVVEVAPARSPYSHH
jgi:FtsP/CotA-like multicopper oxidase with cupredoxin domain